MITFTLLAALLLLVAVVSVILMMRRSVTHLTNIDGEAQNIAIARERLAELEAMQQQNQLSDEEVAQIRAEIEQVLASEIATPVANNIAQSGAGRGRRSAIALAIFVPLFTVLLYLQLGSPSHLTPAEERQAQQLAAAGEVPASMEELVVQLEKRLQQEPDNIDGWFMLGRSYAALNNYPKAVEAYERVYAEVKDNPMVLLALADGLAMLQNGSMQGRPQQLIQQALDIEPQNAIALWLAGHAATETGESEQALQFWYQARRGLQQQPDELEVLNQQITALEQQLGVEPPAPLTPLAAVAEGDEVALQLRVELDAALQNDIRGDEVLFIFARAVSGPPMPLAAVRKQASDLPLTITLDDSQAMMPEMRLSNFEQVNLVARISRTGQPTAQSGDLTGELDAITTRHQQPLLITINRKVP
ncbi:c-type cytochrome biogenesis protein CcmI [Ectothiorhodospiraceae bacterium BW-2]|nr:c-type cytochrome biogenesis protein CcmI [Ectothiorhodospiraceae bacterium BW-2]